MPTRPIVYFVAPAFMAGAVTTILSAGFAPHFPATGLELLARAIFLIGLVFAAAFGSMYAALLTLGEGPKRRARQASCDVAVTAVLVAPLLLFALQRSWLVLVLWLVLLFHVDRLLVSLTHHANEQTLPVSRPASPAFSVLSRGFPYGSSVLGALVLQSAIFAVVSGHDALAGLLYLLGTIVMAYRTLQMFRSEPDRHDLRRDKIAPVLGTVILLTVFSWLPYTLSGGEGGAGSAHNGGSNGPLTTGGNSNSQATNKHALRRRDNPTTVDWLRSIFTLHKPELPGDSFSAAKRIFEARFPVGTERGQSGSKPQAKTGMLTALPVIGPVFPAVELYPAEMRKTKLIAPPPQRSSGFGGAQSNPLAIPFDGVYRFWKGPSEGPPPNVVVMHGSPSVRFFRATDHEIMSMEARESLGFAVDPRFYGAIEIILENVDPFPNTVSIALRIRDSANPGKRFRSLGLVRVSAADSSEDGHPKLQTLRFAVPATISSFDELVVTYYLRGERSDRSARIAIQGFRLVPRAG